MNVTTVFINTYKYDFQFAKICIASVRYWYPDISIVLIKDIGAGNFSTARAEKNWSVTIFETSKKSFGWGYGKLEPLFVEGNSSFLVMDADTVMAGPVIDSVRPLHAQFIVDDEVQPAKRFNEIYYNLDRIHEIDDRFKYPGYSFNSGQWFGTQSVLSREDFDITLYRTDPPTPRFPDIVFNGDQANLNFAIHRKEQLKQVVVHRIRLMIWPESNKADFINLSKIQERQPDYPFIIHWAGMKFKKITDLPRPDILLFYRKYYYSKMGKLQLQADIIYAIYLRCQKWSGLFLKRIRKSIKPK